MAKVQQPLRLPCPLYQCESPTGFDAAEHNAGLWYDKFVDSWEGASWAAAKANKLGWIKTVSQPVGSKSLLEEFADRQRQLARRSHGRTFLLKTESRFATGLGREHPIENGFAWHHTLGTPYLPGSSIKGLVRNWAGHWQSREAEVQEILGGPSAVGRVLLLDALPIDPPVLEPDVMTPHYGEYYQSRGNGIAPPGDWLSPTPVPFLVVAAGQTFQFAMVPNNADDESCLDRVSEWLLAALQWLGAGAKTAVGYGRFAIDHQAQEQLDREAEQRQRALEEAARAATEQAAFEASLANDSEPLRKLKQLQRDQNWQRNAGDNRMVAMLQQFVADNPSLPQDCLEWIRSWLESIPNYQGVWDDPDAMRGKKKDRPAYPAKAVRDLVKQLKQQT